MEILHFTQAEIQPRVVRFADLVATEDFTGATGDLSPETRKAMFSQQVYGLTSPTGDPSVRNFWEAGAVPAGTGNFGAVYVTAGPGEGASWHVHRYSWENFIPLKGTWRIFWNGPEEEHVDLAPHDMVSIPPGAVRRFECIGDEAGLMLAFAYAGFGNLTHPFETTLPPCEVERLDRLGVEGTAEQKDYAARMREVLAASEQVETEADREYLHSVKAWVAREASKG